MALASGSPYYMPPASAKKMAADLASLPGWYAQAGSDVLVAENRQVEWMQKECRFPLPMGWVDGGLSDYEAILAWGWSPALLHALGEKGVVSGIPYTKEQVAFVRELSGRGTAVKLLSELRVEGTLGESFWLTSLDEVMAFSSRFDKVLLKAPWSGSGKGIQPLSGKPDDNLCGWIRRIIASQGGVVGEPFYEKVVDFAMEFQVEAGRVSFVGYSLFEADKRGIYKENWLASDVDIERCLTKYVSSAILAEVRCRLMHELAFKAGEGYQGYLGVDMMICRTTGGYALHPCVEINWRMNMGVVSRLFYDRYMSPCSHGRYVIDYYVHPQEAESFHERMKREYPLKIEGERIVEGYLSLTPVFEDTSYQIYVIIETPSRFLKT